MTLTFKLLQRAYLDLWRPNDPVFLGDNYYLVIIVDNNTRKIWVYGVISKEMFFPVLKIWKKGVETETDLKLSNLQINSRRKYVSLALKKICKKKRVAIKFISFYTPK